jgi:hypothetical protein
MSEKEELPGCTFGWAGNLLNSPRLARVKDPLQVGKFEKASSSKLLKEFRLLYSDNPSSHARPHDEHTLVDSF